MPAHHLTSVFHEAELDPPGRFVGASFNSSRTASYPARLDSGAVSIPSVNFGMLLNTFASTQRSVRIGLTPCRTKRGMLVCQLERGRRAANPSRCALGRSAQAATPAKSRGGLVECNYSTMRYFFDDRFGFGIRRLAWWELLRSSATTASTTCSTTFSLLQLFRVILALRCLDPHGHGPDPGPGLDRVENTCHRCRRFVNHRVSSCHQRSAGG